MDLKEKIIKTNERAMLLGLILNYEFDHNGNIKFIIIFNGYRKEIIRLFVNFREDFFIIYGKNNYFEVTIEITKFIVELHEIFCEKIK